jgi:hypothetical protein
MPKKAKPESPEEQSERFKQAVRDMVAAGELNPTEADAAFNRAMSGVVQLRGQWFKGGAAEEEDQETPP